ncbi:MAG: hypothetical protein C4334_12155 [Pyrinomonas sp.]|mgnify:CR=1 FL=1|uniref:glycosyltransferase n=1 Tax=Pyrinomonas sp. TaxID=2080306 RepID=UPI003324519F
MGRDANSNTNVSRRIDATLLVCTYNRSQDLHEMLQTAVAQETAGSFAYEIIVVDNNSTDDTRRVVESFGASHENVRYLFEERQGKSYALNRGLEAVRGEIYTIADDDFILPNDWLRKIFEAFRAHPEVSFVSGKVLPLWEATPPAWLTPRHWSAIAMADYGDEPFYVDENRQICLLACSFRTADVRAVGGYRVGLSVSKGRIGGTEDLEILQRLWRSGRKGIYLPHIYFYHKVGAGRLTKRYHRRWHTGHGMSYAIMRDGDFEKSSARLFDVPAHLYRQAAGHAVGWLRQKLARNEPEAFWHECQLRFCWGFFQQRRVDYAAQRKHGAVTEAMRFARSLLGKRTGSLPSDAAEKTGR